MRRCRSRPQSVATRDDRGHALDHGRSNQVHHHRQGQGASERGDSDWEGYRCHQIPAPKFWAGDGGAFIGTGNIAFTSAPETHAECPSSRL